MSRWTVGLLVASWFVAVPAHADTCKSLGVGSSSSSRTAISTEIRPSVGEPLLLTLEIVSGVPQMVLKAKSGKAPATAEAAVFVFDGGKRASWPFTSPADGTYLFTPLTAEQLDTLGSKSVFAVQLPLATGGHDDFVFDKVNQKALMDGAKCVASRVEG